MRIASELDRCASYQREVQTFEPNLSVSDVARHCFIGTVINTAGVSAKFRDRYNYNAGDDGVFYSALGLRHILEAIDNKTLPGYSAEDVKQVELALEAVELRSASLPQP